MKDLQKLGKVLTKQEKKAITGGKFVCCYTRPECPSYNNTGCVIIDGECRYYPDEGTSC